jgi:hypothetical protein
MPSTTLVQVSLLTNVMRRNNLRRDINPRSAS